MRMTTSAQLPGTRAKLLGVRLILSTPLAMGLCGGGGEGGGDGGDGLGGGG